MCFMKTFERHQRLASLSYSNTFPVHLFMEYFVLYRLLLTDGDDDDDGIPITIIIFYRHASLSNSSAL